MDSPKLFRWLAGAVILSYLAVLAIGFFMPLQTDEIGWLYITRRAWMDGKEAITLYPQCGKQTFTYPLPFIWYVPAFFNYLTYDRIDNPIWIRVIGMLQFFLWLGLWQAIAMKLFSVPRRFWWIVLSLILAFVGLDALPLALLVNRPEQVLLIGAGTAVACALYADALSRNWFLRTFSTCWLFFVVMYVHSSHPKSMMLLPVECIMYAIFLQRAWKSRIIAAVGICAVIGIGVQSYGIYAGQLQCPGTDILKEYFLEFYLPVETLWTAPLAFLLSALRNVLFSCFSTLYLQSYLQYTHEWLPFTLQPLNIVGTYLAEILDTGALFFYLWFLATSALTCWKELKLSEPPKPAWLGLASLMVAIGILFVFMRHGMFYFVPLTVPLLLLASFFAFSLKCRETPRKIVAHARLATVLLAAAFLNQMLLVVRYEGLFHPQNFDVRVLTSTQDFAQKRADILDLAGQCHISMDSTLRHLVTDDLTYNVFHTSWEPLSFSYSSWICCSKNAKPGERKSPFSTTEYLKMLASYGSDGVIAQCSLFPEGWQQYTIEHGGFCCISKATIETHAH